MSQKEAHPPGKLQVMTLVAVHIGRSKQMTNVNRAKTHFTKADFVYIIAIANSLSQILQLHNKKVCCYMSIVYTKYLN